METKHEKYLTMNSSMKSRPKSNYRNKNNKINNFIPGDRPEVGG
jgi:hypothetical protein